MALPIARVSANDKSASSATTSVAAAFTTGLTGVNSIFAIVVANVAAGIVSVDNSFQLMHERALGNFSVSVWGRGVGGVLAGTTPTITASAAGASVMQMHLYEYSGVRTTLLIPNEDGENDNSTGSTVTSLGTGAISTVFADDLIIVAAGSIGGANGGTTSWATATNLQPAATNRLIVGQYLPATELSGFSDTASWLTARSAVTVIVSFQPEQTAASSTDTGTGTDSAGTVAATLSDADIATATDAEVSLAAAASESDSATGTDAEVSVAAAVSQDEPATATDAGTVAATLSETETATATDAESLTATLTSADTATSSEDASAAVGVSNAETGAGTETAIAIAGASESDEATATDDEGAALAPSDDDPATATEIEAVNATLTDSDTATATDAELVGVPAADSDTGSATEASALAAGVSAAEAAVVAEAEAIIVYVFDTETATATDAQSVDTAGTGGWLVGAAHL